MSTTMHIPARLIAALALALLLGACVEEVNITDATYRERLVVHAVLDPDEPIDVQFTRTLPIDRPYSDAEAALDDVVGSIVVYDQQPPRNGIRFPLVHVGNGHYEARPPGGTLGLTPREGYEYQLEATWRGRSVRARTLVPLPPDVDSAMFVPSSWGGDEAVSVRAVIDPFPGEVYMLITGTYDPMTNEPYIPSRYSAPIARDRDTTADGSIVMVDEWSSYGGTDRVAAAVFAFDEPYYEFQRTYFRGDDMGPFGSGADIVRWNVEGDGIGLFIGRTRVVVPVQR